MPDWTSPKWRRIWIAWTIFGGLTAVIGVAGIPDDVKKWGEWSNALATLLGHEAIRWVLFIAGMSIVVLVNILPRVRRPSVVAPQPMTAASNALVTQSRPKHNSVAPSPAPAIPRFNPATIGDLMVFRQMVRTGKVRSDAPEDSIPPMKCPICKGKGLRWGRYEDICTQCGGTGELPGELSHFPRCQICSGTGLKYGRYEAHCHVCNGLGVRIPDMRYRK